MPRLAFRRLALILLVAMTAHCGYDTTAPGPYDPPRPDPPGSADPPAATINEGLWTVSGSEPAILRLAPSQLLTSDNVSAATTVRTTTATLFTLSAVAFDAAGTMWIASRDDSLVLAFSPAAIATSGTREASRVIAPTSRSLRGPTGLAFDPRHRLWVANFDDGTIVRFDSAQLASSGAPVPPKVLRIGGRPIALAFDAAGDLWVAQFGSHSIIKYSATQLDVSESPVPEVVLSANAGSLTNPAALAFDASGNLWVTNIGSQTVVAFSQAELAATGSPAPHVTLSSNSGSLSIPTALAFDGTGSLWVANADGLLEKFSGADLRATGAPEPKVRLRLNGNALLWSLAFWPTPGGLPLN